MARAQAASAGQRVVVVTERGSRPPDGAQAYLATSLARWLNEQKTDGAGRCALANRPTSPPPPAPQFAHIHILPRVCWVTLRTVGVCVVRRRAYGEVKDEDPTLRKKFTREQILAIQAFGRA